MSTTQKCNGGADRSATLRALADLCSTLPAPFEVRFVEESLALDFGSVADLVAWSAQLGLTQMCLRHPSPDGGSLYTNFNGQWRGWNVGATVLERVGCHGSTGSPDVASIRIRERCRCSWVTGWYEAEADAAAALAAHVARAQPAIPPTVDIPARDLAELNPQADKAAQLMSMMQATSRLGGLGGAA